MGDNEGNTTATLKGHTLDRNSEQYKSFQKWALQNYGDSGKTKTVTRKKYNRIVRTLLEQEDSYSVENSKFRFWVKAKGFILGDGPDGEKILYIPTKISVSPQGAAETQKEYKRVAIVEDFFDIIYDVHVEMEGRGGKHAGQKRTYRAIAETYSFLPREAVTRFLMSCSDCQRRMHGVQAHTSQENNNTTGGSHPDIDFSMPITTTYLNHIRNRGLFCNTLDPDFAFDMKYEETMSTGDSELSRTPSPSVNDASPSPRPPELKQEESLDAASSRTSTPVTLLQAGDTKPDVKNGEKTTSVSPKPEIKSEDKGHPERKRRASDEVSLDDSSAKASEADDGKDDDDDDDNEDDLEKLQPGHGYDPERLKSFNMFVRLFVDENLDRMVPISKQPKDKIQAILDACDRQFPEFHIRSRKRVRTYLKSCRRMRRSKEGTNGWEPLRPTPPHLTSAAAESLLAQACENESENAKRMRMGLEPLPGGVMNAKRDRERAEQAAAASQAPPSKPSQPAQSQHPPQLDRQPTPSLLSDFMRQAPPHAFRPPHEMPPFFPATNGLFRPGFPAAFPAHHPSPVLTASPLTGQMQNGPTDLSVKKSSSSQSQTSNTSTNSKNQLNPNEISTIKQLIAGYRESASFLYRSADELEQLLLQQN